MKKWYRVQENGVNLVFLVTEKGEVFFVHCQKSGFEEKEIPEDQLEGLPAGTASGRRRGSG